QEGQGMLDLSPEGALVNSPGRQPWVTWVANLAFLLLWPALALAQEKPPLVLPKGWGITAPLVSPAVRRDDPCYSVKDPSVVYFEGRWHLFCTIRSKKRLRQIEYRSFKDWKDADKAEPHVLKLSEKDFCAPQVFYYTPHKKWYLVYQVVDNKRRPN